MAALLGSRREGQVLLVAGVGRDLVDRRAHAGKWVTVAANGWAAAVAATRHGPGRRQRCRKTPPSL